MSGRAGNANGTQTGSSGGATEWARRATEWAKRWRCWCSRRHQKRGRPSWGVEEAQQQQAARTTRIVAAQFRCSRLSLDSSPPRASPIPTAQRIGASQNPTTWMGRVTARGAACGNWTWRPWLLQPPDPHSCCARAPHVQDTANLVQLPSRFTSHMYSLTALPLLSLARVVGSTGLPHISQMILVHSLPSPSSPTLSP